MSVRVKLQILGLLIGGSRQPSRRIPSYCLYRLKKVRGLRICLPIPQSEYEQLIVELEQKARYHVLCEKRALERTKGGLSLLRTLPRQCVNAETHTQLAKFVNVPQQRSQMFKSVVIQAFQKKFRAEAWYLHAFTFRADVTIELNAKR